MQELDKLVINFDEGQLFLLNICLGFLMFGIALDLSTKDFKFVFQHPKSVLVGLSSQLILLPVLTLMLIFIWKPPYSIQLGMVLIACCPGGNVSNYMVHRSNGNTALSITLTSIVTLAAVIITPFSFYLWSVFLQTPPNLDQTLAVDFGKMITIIFQLILVPISIGMIVNHYLPQIKKHIIKPVKWFSILLLIGIIIFALMGNVKQIRGYLSLVFLLVFIHNGLALLLGYQYARWWKLPKIDAKAISIETGIQNGGLGLILIFNYFEGLGGMTLVAAWWGVWHLISGFLLSSYWAFSIPDALSLIFLKRK